MPILGMSTRDNFSTQIPSKLPISMIKRCCDANFNSFLVSLPCCYLKRPLKRYFLDVCLTTFSDSVISEMQNLWGSSLFKKLSKFQLDIKNAEKKLENVFCVWDNIIWIGIFNWSLLRTGYLFSAANVLTSSPKTWYVNKRCFFQLKCLESYQ